MWQNTVLYTSQFVPDYSVQPILVCYTLQYVTHRLMLHITVSNTSQYATDDSM